MNLKPLYLFKQQAIDNAKSNPDLFWEGIVSNPLDADKAMSFLGNDYKEKTTFLFDFSFSMDGYQKPEDSDFNNTVLLYKALNTIPKNVLFSESFLSGFLFTYGYEYLHWRWIPSYNNNPERLPGVRKQKGMGGSRFADQGQQV